MATVVGVGVGVAAAAFFVSYTAVDSTVTVLMVNFEGTSRFSSIQKI